jgi:hypothetical protein
MPSRKPYPSGVPVQEWSFVAPYLALVDAIEDGVWPRTVEPPEARRGFSASSRERMVEYNFPWIAVLGGWPEVAFACPFLNQAVSFSIRVHNTL